MQVFFLLWLVLFAAVVLAASLGFKYLETSRRKHVSEILHAVSDMAGVSKIPLLKMAQPLGRSGERAHHWWDPLKEKLDARVHEAGLNWPGWLLPLVVVVGASIGFAIGNQFHVPFYREFALILLTLLGGMIPLLFVNIKRSSRLRAFEEQFPEALDFLARSMRAGHAFSSSLEMLSDESLDPLGSEFRRVFHEQNLGAPLETALRNLHRRVPLVDVGFFVSSVLLQRETGGNLAEILTNLAYVIRERFRLKGQVRAASAHGRVTAVVLTVLPMATTIALLIIAPGYLESMAVDAHGKYLVIGAIAGQFLGYYIMSRIVDIKV